MRDKLHVRDILSRGIVGAALAFLTTMGLPSDARAVPIVDGGSTSFTASGTNGGVPFSVTGSVTFDIIDATHVLFDFNFLNTSPNDPNVVQEDRMVTFAFDFSGITVTLNSNLATTDNDANDVWTAVLRVDQQSTAVRRRCLRVFWQQLRWWWEWWPASWRVDECWCYYYRSSASAAYLRCGLCTIPEHWTNSGR